MKLLLILVCLALVACSDKFDTLDPNRVIKIYQGLPTGSSEKTNHLFDAISDSTLGESGGVVELRHNGILIQPGLTPTTVTFNVSDKRLLSFKPFISRLPAKAFSLKEAATVKVEVLVNNKLIDEFEVDRKSTTLKEYNVQNSHYITIRVSDNGNGSVYDWFTLDVVGLV